MTAISLASTLLISCAGPKFAGLKKETMETKQVDLTTNKITNYQMQLSFINQLTLAPQILNQLDKEKLTIVANYSLYPFNAKKGDTPDSLNMIDNNINGELTNVLERNLIQSGYRVLENYSAYNLTLDNNFDEYQQMLVFDLKGLGIYYEHITDELVIRHVGCNIRYKVLDKDGIIRTISDFSSDKKDTITIQEIPSVNQLPVGLSYLNLKQDSHLSQTNLPALTSSPVQTIYSAPPKETNNTTEKVVGIKFKVPNETKSYSILVLDNSAYSDLIRLKGNTISKNDISSLSPKILSIKSNEKSSEQGNDGNKTYSYFSILKAEDLSGLFEKSKEVVLINKLKKLCVLRQLSDGSIITIE